MGTTVVWSLEQSGKSSLPSVPRNTLCMAKGNQKQGPLGNSDIARRAGHGVRGATPDAGRDSAVWANRCRALFPLLQMQRTP